MIKLVYCISKKPELTDKEFFHYWEKVHGPIGVRIPHLRRLVQSHRVNVTATTFSPTTMVWRSFGSTMQRHYLQRGNHVNGRPHVKTNRTS